MIKIEIVRKLITPFPSTDFETQDGAELVFNGHVRATEHGKKITGLEYEQYEGMAEHELKRLAEETVKIFRIHDLYCRHRIGIVKVGEISLHVMILSKHRKEGLSALEYFITELKKTVPIWKWAMLMNGKKIPSKCHLN